MAVRFSIGSQASSPISEAITAPNDIFQFEIRNNKLDQPQGMSAKMAANGIRIHARTNPVTYTGIEVAAILKRRTALY